VAPRTAGRALSASIRPATRPTTSSQLSPSIAATGRRQYHEKVLDHYSRPRNVGSMSKTDTDVGTGLVGAPACGDVMKLQIRVDPNNNTISDVKFKTFGCGSAIASSSYLTELVRGMTLEEAGRVRNTEIAKELCLPPVKRKYRQVQSPAEMLILPQSIVLCSPRMLLSPLFPITIRRTPLLVQLIWEELEQACQKLMSRPLWNPPPPRLRLREMI